MNLSCGLKHDLQTKRVISDDGQTLRVRWVVLFLPEKLVLTQRRFALVQTLF